MAGFYLPQDGKRTSPFEEEAWFLFKTDYEDDIRLFPHSATSIPTMLLAVLLIAPYVLSAIW